MQKKKKKSLRHISTAVALTRAAIEVGLRPTRNNGSEALACVQVIALLEGRLASARQRINEEFAP